MDIRVIINGKKAGLEPVRSAIFKARESGLVEVRATWEGGDVSRLVQEASKEGCQRVVAAGGDGTVNEVVDAILHLPAEEQPEMAILPLGTANDFAMGCTIPVTSFSALTLAQTGTSYRVDAVSANQYHFINVASGGFGAQVTAKTPIALKNFFGGGAYTLSGLAQAVSFVPFHGEVRFPHGSSSNHMIVGAVCNGRQSGGGQQLAPGAMIDDGLLDIIALNQFPPEKILQVIDEFNNPKLIGDYVKRYRVPWVEWASEMEMPINLDGEPIGVKRIRFEVKPGAIKLVLPDHCPMTSYGA